LTTHNKPFTKLTTDAKRELLAQMLRQRASASRSINPLSVGQRALWYQYQLAPTSAAYNIGFTARIVSEVNIDALKTAVEKVVERHPQLRTTYVMNKGAPRMEIHGFLAPGFEQHDASHLSDAELLEKVRNSYRQPFDLQQGPLLRVALFTRSATDHVLLLTVHHISSDGWSMGILLNDFKVFYKAAASGTKAVLMPIPQAYTDFVKTQSRLFESSQGEQLWTYWKNELSGELPLLNLPLDRQRPPVRRFRGSTHNFELDNSFYSLIKSLAKSEGVTTYTLLLSVYQTLLMRYSGQEEILIGAPVAGRTRSEFEPIVGFFINQIVLRGNLSDNPTFQKLLVRNRQKVMGALEHQDYPFAMLVEQLQVARDPSHYPIFQVLFNMLQRQTLGSIGSLLDGTAYDSPVEFGSLKLMPYDFNQQEGQFDLSLEMIDTGSRFLSSLRYNSDVFDETTVIRIEKHFRMLLKRLLSTSAARIWAYPLSKSSDAIVDPTCPITHENSEIVHKKKKKIAQQKPEQIAIVDATDTWTYAE